MYDLPFIELPTGVTVRGPHPEYVQHVQDLRWRVHSWVGGRTYRDAEYGADYAGFAIRNLARNKRDYPVYLDAPEPERYAASIDYEMRRARTPVPAFTAEAVGKHLSKVFAKEIRREGPELVVEWWRSVNVRRETIDQWWKHAVAPLLLVLGQLDILCDRPRVPDGQEVVSRADEERLGLNRCVASYILPENLVWWDLLDDQSYASCLVIEHGQGKPRYRWWGPDAWVLYDERGKEIGRGDHPAGVCPVVRIFDKRDPMCVNVGLSRYTPVMEIQREYWNRDSELTLSDSLQAFPMLQMPEEYCTANADIPMGPGRVLPMKAIKGPGGGTTGYQGVEAIDWPKDSADSIRQNLQVMRDAVDRYARLTKPAGTSGTGGNTVSQSGVSKQLDAVDGNDLLTEIADSLSAGEVRVAAMAYRVLSGGKPPKPGEIRVSYPADFALYTGSEMADNHGKFIMSANAAGMTPKIDAAYLKRTIRGHMPGLDDATYAEFDAEIDALVARGSQQQPGSMMPDPTGEYS